MKREEAREAALAADGVAFGKAELVEGVAYRLGYRNGFDAGAARYEGALRECRDAIAAMELADRRFSDVEEQRLRQALASASDLLEGGNDGQD